MSQHVGSKNSFRSLVYTFSIFLFLQGCQQKVDNNNLNFEGTAEIEERVKKSKTTLSNQSKAKGKKKSSGNNSSQNQAVYSIGSPYFHFNANDPWSVYDNGDGTVWIPMSHRVMKYNLTTGYVEAQITSGNFLGDPNSEHCPYPVSLTKAAGFIYVTCYHNVADYIQKYDESTLDHVETITSSGGVNFVEPREIEFYDNKFFLIEHSGRRMRIMDASWNAITTINLPSNGGGFAIDTTNNQLLVSCSNAGIVYRYDMDGTLDSTFKSGLSYPNDVMIYNNKVYIAEQTDDEVKVYDLNTGTHLYDIATSFGATHSIVINGQLYVSNSDTFSGSKATQGDITIHDPDTGALIKTIVEPEGSMPFTSGVGFDVSADGTKFYVSDIANHDVKIIDRATQTVISSFGGYGTGNGQLNGPRGLALDSSDNVYVSDYSNKRICKFSPTGVFDSCWNNWGSQSIYNIAIDENDVIYGGVWVSSNANIHKYDTSGNHLGNVGSGFKYPIAMYPDPSDNKIYVANYGDAQLDIVDATTGITTSSIGTEGNQLGELWRPRGIYSDRTHIWVTESNNRIVKFHVNGTYVTSYSSRGTEDGKMAAPSDLKLDSDGTTLLLRDSGGNRIQRFEMAAEEFVPITQ